MIKAGFIAGSATGESSIDELYAEMSLPDQAFGSTIDELYAEVVIGATEWGSTVDELYVELAFASAL